MTEACALPRHPFHVGKNCHIDPTAVIKVESGFIGEGAIIRAHARIEGTHIEIGREAFIDERASIGGGSCFDPEAFLKAGDFFHMGVGSHINIARGVTIGHEFGCGIETKIFTHGAYTDSYNMGSPVQWAPVRIGDSVWLPNAWVNPGVEIGSQVVVAARSLINCSLPDGCLAGGIPAKILKEKSFPRTLSVSEKEILIKSITEAAAKRLTSANKLNGPADISWQEDVLTLHWRSQKTQFFLKEKTIEGAANEASLIHKDQLRRNGIRFRFENTDGVFTPWKSSVRP